MTATDKVLLPHAELLLVGPFPIATAHTRLRQGDGTIHPPRPPTPWVHKTRRVEHVPNAKPYYHDAARKRRDFLREAVHYATMTTPRNWKYAILHLCSALELLFKAILEQAHWSLIFENVNEASGRKLHTGDFHSVRFDTAIKRLSTPISN